MSNTTRVLILGAGGMLGRYLVPVFRNAGFDVTPSTRQTFDVLKDRWTDIPWDSYHAVVNALGVIPQKNQNPQILREVNAEFPREVAPKCQKWIQVSTDCVFSGNRGSYSITDRPDPKDDYGISKFAGEVGVVVRGSFVGEGEPRALLEVVRGSDVMFGYVDHYWNGVSCLTMARTLVTIAGMDITSGLFHVASMERVSKYGLCRRIAEVYEHKIAIEPVHAGFVDRTLVPTVEVQTSIQLQLEIQRRFTCNH